MRDERVRIYKCYWCVVFKYLHAFHRFAGGPYNKLFKSLNNLFRFFFLFVLSVIYFMFLTRTSELWGFVRSREHHSVYIQFNVPSFSTVNLGNFSLLFKNPFNSNVKFAKIEYYILLVFNAKETKFFEFVINFLLFSSLSPDR